MVVDSSVLVAALIDEGSVGTWAEEIIAAGNLHAPELLPAETANVLRRLESTKSITASQATAAFEDTMRLAVELFSFDPFGGRVWALRHSVSSYDAWYVAVAESLGSPLATLDRKLARSSGPRCRFLLPPGS